MMKDTPPGFAKEFCAKAKAELAASYKAAIASPGIPGHQKAYLTGELQRVQQLCERPSPQTLRAYYWFPLERDTKSCRLRASAWRETFIQNATRVWVSNRGPAGLCGEINVSTLEQTPFDPNPQNKLLPWTYETQKIQTVKNCLLAGEPGYETKARYSKTGQDPSFGCEVMGLEGWPN